MRQTLAAIMFVAAASLLSGSALAQKIDANGRCHGADGKFAKMEVCKPPEKAADAPKQCRDKTSKKFAKCDAPNTEPVPAKAK
ncbi:hypothetical protein [Roseiterribacter gracilis]|uniref:Phosphate starvation-inducible protein PsiF n=1 Tax=Roseiterribacter gracilis TaxID=2812848 RepID=A0A8S8XCW0_9PROT|nr:hypothetical protein TMPK1_13440 [Rhodospirillales bacterium TMPK1]